MDKLGVYAPTFVGLAALAYTWFIVRRIKREQERAREMRAAE